MTPEILEYLLRLTVIWAVLLAYYFVALRRAGFAAQRFYLLGTLAFGLVVPLLPVLGGGLPVAGLPSVTYVAEPFFYTGGAEVETAASSWSWFTVLPWLYLTGLAFFLARTLVQWKGLWHWVSSGTTDRYDGYRVVRHGNINGPFVAFGCIFLPTEMTDADLEHTALIHEASHLRARHHYDTLLLTIGSLLLWFHPLFWMLRSLLATVHEYAADAAVIQRVPVRTYGLQLLHASLGPAGYPGLFSSPITKRIAMITDKKRVGKLPTLTLFSLCLLLTGLAATCSSLYSEESYEKGYEDGKVAAEKAFEEFVDVFAETVYKKIVYPAAARSAGETGSFDFLIDIDETGRITDFKYNKENSGNDPVGEITLVGTGIANKGKTGTSDILVKEILQVLIDLQLPEPFMIMEIAMPTKLRIRFNFKLEE
jgi:hypothetical protein